MAFYQRKYGLVLSTEACEVWWLGKSILVQADYRDQRHARDIGYLINAYAQDPMGGGRALDITITKKLAHALSAVPGAFTVLCYRGTEPAGLINCFNGFSTFECAPLVNVHDIFVLSEYRGLGLCQRMLSEVEQIARDRECCKITMEVLEGNVIARKAYRKFGFDGYQLDPQMGKALFWQKSLKE